VTPEQEARRGDQAKRILEDEIYREAYDTIRKEIFDQWQSSPARDAEGREKLWLTLKILDRVNTHFVSVMESGKLARSRLDRLTGQRPSL
jgi:hypothetical protein